MAGSGTTSAVASAASTDIDDVQTEANVRSGDASEPYFLDPVRGKIPFREEYERWFGDERRPPHYLRTVLELVGVLGIGTSYYWIVSDPNKQDWDYIDIRDRSLHVEVKFDNNMFRTNFLMHPGAGMLSYWLARSNGLNIFASFASSALSSASFEFLLEWLEKPSINDLMVTPIGGIAAGEFFFHLGDYLNSAVDGGNTGQRILAYSIGAPQAIHDALDGHRLRPSSVNALGYTSAYWHSFKFGFGVADVGDYAGDRDTVYDLLFHMKLVAMPGFLLPGRFSVNFHQGNFTEARLRTSLARGLLKDVDLWIGADLVGHYRQDFTGTAAALVGSGAMLAASVDMRYVDRWLFHRDQFALFHFLGPSGAAWFGLGNGVMANVEGRFHLDFAGITSPAYEKLATAFGPEGTKSVLQLQNYFLGMGGSGRIDASIAWAGAELGGFASYGAYRSIDGLDRYPTPLDVSNTEQLIELGAALSYTPPAAPLSFRAGWQSFEHRSQMGPFAVSLRDWRLSASAAISF